MGLNQRRVSGRSAPSHGSGTATIRSTTLFMWSLDQSASICKAPRKRWCSPCAKSLRCAQTAAPRHECG